MDEVIHSEIIIDADVLFKQLAFLLKKRANTPTAYKIFAINIFQSSIDSYWAKFQT